MKHRFLIVLGFLCAIAAGTILLMLPVSSPSHTWMKPMDALFTACSAVCITGLSVIDVGRDLSLFGQGVMLLLVQLGCVGVMTAGTFFLVFVGRRISLESEFTLMNAYGVSGVKGFRALIVWVVLLMLGIELIGTVALWATFTLGAGVEWEVALADRLAWYRAYFYSVMTFCNAGFSIDPGSLAVFGAKPLALVVMAVLLTLGGFGFLVLYNVCTIKFWRRNLVTRGRLSLHTRVVLLWSLLFTAGMFAVFCALEWNGALDPFRWFEKPAVALFQAATPRTCGFTVIPVNDLHPATRFLTEVLMFIGAAPGGAGGGIKITTLAVFVVTLLAICRGRRDSVIFRKTIPETVVREAVVIVVVFAAAITLGMTVLLVTEHGNEALSFESLLFETVSAVSTTGLSCGSTTAALSVPGRFVLMLCMFTGRLGAITVVMLIGGLEEQVTIRYPREELVVG